MPKLALRGLAARKLRALSTILAVFLGVALMSGTYVLTDTINASFNDIFKESLKGTDVVVTPREPIRLENGEPPPLPQSLVPRVRRVRGVAAAAGGVFTPGGFFDAKGKQVGAHFAPKFVSSVFPKRFETLNYVKGRPPRTRAETSIDRQSADRSKLHLGDPLVIAGERRAKRYRIVGFTKLGQTSFGGASIAQLVLPEAQLITDKVGKLDQISVAADKGVSPATLRDRIRSALGPSVKVETGQQSADRESREIANDLGFIKIVLLVFAGVALFVGAFLIFNTFSITVAQRVREFGLLRTLGASGNQVLGSVLIEAGLIGLLGSLTGLAGGLAFAPGINALFKAIGIDLPNTGTVIEGRTVIVALAVGLGVTSISALPPALRATRVPPIAALREAELPETRRRGPVYGALAVLLCIGGVVAACIGLFGGIEDSGSAAALMGGGAASVLLGVSLFSPRLVRPLASLVGRPLERLRGIAGRLARENAVRKPGRTAVTAAALMIGLALVTFVTVFAAGIKGSIASAIDRNFQGDLVIQNIDNFSPIPARAAQAARRVDGVKTVSSLRFSQARVSGVHGDSRVSGIDPANVNDVLSLDWKKGGPDTARRLRGDQAVIDQAWGRSKGIGVGDTIRALTPTGAHTRFRVTGSVKDNADLLGDFVITQNVMARGFGERRDSIDFVDVRPGADPNVVQRRLDRVMKTGFPTTEVLNQSELKDRQEQSINQLLGLIYALLSLAVLVSLFGIVNTLALSIHERTRELGMLRAIGMSRAQVRRVIRYEAVITALIGAVLGSVLGVVFAALVSRPLADEGFTLRFPVPTLVLLLVLAALAGVVAAIVPARRAARLNVLEALAYE